MPTIAIAKAENFLEADTAATANTVVMRDGSGNIAGAQLGGSELKSTGVLTLARSLKTTAFTAGVAATLFSCDATSSAFAATLPPAATCAGRVYAFKKIDASANAVTVTGSGAETIDGANTLALSSQWAKTMIVSNGTSWETV